MANQRKWGRIKETRFTTVLVIVEAENWGFVILFSRL
jgi:uncharacterized membrane protein YuzA (DUF378 family)